MVLRKKSKVLLLCCLFFFVSSQQDLYALSLDLRTNFIHINNLDFQSYDKDKYRQNKSIDFLNTDDRANILYGSLNLRFDTQYKNTKFFLDIARQGYWGTDNFQGRDDGQNPILINRLYFSYSPGKIFSIHFGRHRYEIADARLDFFFSDVIDGLQINYQINGVLRVNLMADIVALAFRPDDAGIFSVVRKDSEQLGDFQSDTLTFRVGSYFNIKIHNELLYIKPFAYYLRYGATTDGGADLSENGRNTLNRADSDFLIMGGARFFGSIGERGGYDLTAAYSYGKDYQFDDERKYNGLAVAANYAYGFLSSDALHVSIKATLGYFHQDFISMKARSPAGILLWGMKSYHAAPYAYFYHFRDYAKRKDAIRWFDRTNAKTFFLFAPELSYKAWQTSIHVLPLFETRSREINNRAFSYMGTEIEFKLSYRFDNIKLTLIPAIYLPSTYYLERSAISNFLPPGQDPFYAVLFNVSSVFDLDFIAASEEPKKPKDRSKELLEEEEETIE